MGHTTTTAAILGVIFHPNGKTSYRLCTKYDNCSFSHSWDTNFLLLLLVLVCCVNTIITILFYLQLSIILGLLMLFLPPHTLLTVWDLRCWLTTCVLVRGC